MADYEYQGARSLQTTLNKLKVVLDTLYQKQEDGKGLSTNDLTDDLLQKLVDLKAVTASAEMDKGIKVASIKIGDDTTDIYIPEIEALDTEMSDTSIKGVQNKVIKKYVDDIAKGLTGINFEVVDQLPAVGEKGVIYLVPNGTEGTNVYDEYIWANGAFERIGSTAADLSGYVKTTDIVQLTDEEIVDIFKVVFPTVDFTA